MDKQVNWLTRQHKESIVLLSVGTFLEYFDLMLYIHMAVLLNELFFPQGDPLIAQLLAAFAFCSTFLLRPIGGMLVGWIGDHIGRKSTIILTTSVMAITCIIMAIVGTYDEIGITASIIVIICRGLQGVSSLGEIIGAQLYLTETLKQPYKYVANGIVEIGSRLGGLFALMIALFATSFHLNWRIAFWIGATIALVGLFARIRLREAPEFLDFQRRMKMKAELNKLNLKLIEKSLAYQEKIDKKALLSYFLVRLAMPVCFYITYIYIGGFMKESLSMTAEEVINQNLIVTVLTVIGLLITIVLVRKHHPIKIAVKYILCFSIFLPFLPYSLNYLSNQGNINNYIDMLSLTCIQFLTFSMALCLFAIEMSCFRYIPMARRFTILATTFGIASAVSYTLVSFSLIPVIKYFGYYGLWFIYIPTILSLLYSIQYIRKLENSTGKYLYYPDEDNTITLYKGQEKEKYNYNFIDQSCYKKYRANCKYEQELLNIVMNKAAQENKKIDLQLIKKAIIFARRWHDGQFRDNGDPFYSHPFAVAGIVAEYYLETNVIIGAILHDVVEDSLCPLKLIEEEFNQRIAQIVDRLTRIRLESGNKVILSLEETVNNLYASKDFEALLIKQVDRLHNLYTIGDQPEETQIRKALETHHNLLTTVSYNCDKLNIMNNLKLETKLFTKCRNILGKRDFM